jgi:hypothetical protein
VERKEDKFKQQQGKKGGTDNRSKKIVTTAGLN